MEKEYVVPGIFDAKMARSVVAKHAIESNIAIRFVYDEIFDACQGGDLFVECSTPLDDIIIMILENDNYHIQWDNEQKKSIISWYDRLNPARNGFGY